MKAESPRMMQPPRQTPTIEQVQQGEEVENVVPEEREVLGKMLLSPIGTGKLRTGQRANIRLDAYSSYLF